MVACAVGVEFCDSYMRLRVRVIEVFTVDHVPDLEVTNQFFGVCCFLHSGTIILNGISVRCRLDPIWGRCKNPALLWQRKKKWKKCFLRFSNKLPKCSLRPYGVNVHFKKRQLFFSSFWAQNSIHLPRNGHFDPSATYWFRRATHLTVP